MFILTLVIFVYDVLFYASLGRSQWKALMHFKIITLNNISDFSILNFIKLM